MPNDFLLSFSSAKESGKKAEPIPMSNIHYAEMAWTEIGNERQNLIEHVKLNVTAIIVPVEHTVGTGYPSNYERVLAGKIS